MAENFLKFLIRDVKLIVSGRAYEVSSFTADYSLDTIPRAVVTLPLGRSMYTWYPSDAYEIMAGFDNFYHQRAYLVISIEAQTPGLTPFITSGEYLVFEGYIKQGIYNVTGDQASFVITLDHWLSDLTFSSTLSSSSHPNNPKALIYNPALFSTSAGGGLNFSLAGVMQRILMNPIPDLWRGAIIPLLALLISTDRINFQRLGFGNDTLTGAVAQALMAYGDSTLSLTGLPMEIALEMMESAIGLFDQRGPDPLETFANITVWQKIQEFAKQYMFSIIPFPTYYLAAPITLGLIYPYEPYGPPTIASQEIFDFTYHDVRPQAPLRAMGIYRGYRTYAGGALSNPEIIDDYSIGGWYIRIPDPGFGLVEILKAPTYLEQSYEPSIYTRDAVGGLVTQMASSRNPIARSIAHAFQQKLLRQYSMSVLDRVAHASFLASQLEGRVASVVCPFRGDICPGATISLSLHNNEFIPGYMDSPVLYGTVTAVQYKMAPNQAPTTQYTIRGVTTYFERQSLNYATTSHPLYDVFFYGRQHLPRFA